MVLIMDLTILSTVVSNLGFPIAACCAMFYMLEKQSKRHSEEVEKLTKALDNNTEVMEEILAKFKEVV
jgi:hypothetical protein